MQTLEPADLRAWLAERPPPIEEKLSQSELLDTRVVEFACSGDYQLELPTLEGVERLWVHTRCSQLGLTSVSNGHSRNSKTMTLSKPATWRFDLARPVPEPVPEPAKRKTAKQRKRERMEAWRTECDQCGTELDAASALYHRGGMGPMCEECVEADPELEGLKWEEKAAFWR
jgi:hypothetical protein